MTLDQAWLFKTINESERRNRLRRLAIDLLKSLGAPKHQHDLAPALQIAQEAPSNLEALHAWLRREHPHATWKDRADLEEQLKRRLTTWELDRWV